MEYYSCKQAAEYVHFSKRTIIDWSKNKKLPFIRTPGGHKRYHIDDLNKIRKLNSERTMKGDNAKEKRMAIMSPEEALRILAKSLSSETGKEERMEIKYFYISNKHSSGRIKTSKEIDLEIDEQLGTMRMSYPNVKPYCFDSDCPNNFDSKEDLKLIIRQVILENRFKTIYVPNKESLGNNPETIAMIEYICNLRECNIGYQDPKETINLKSENSASLPFPEHPIPVNLKVESENEESEREEESDSDSEEIKTSIKRRTSPIIETPKKRSLAEQQARRNAILNRDRTKDRKSDSKGRGAICRRVNVNSDSD